MNLCIHRLKESAHCCEKGVHVAGASVSCQPRVSHGEEWVTSCNGVGELPHAIAHFMCRCCVALANRTFGSHNDPAGRTPPSHPPRGDSRGTPSGAKQSQWTHVVRHTLRAECMDEIDFLCHVGASCQTLLKNNKHLLQKCILNRCVNYDSDDNLGQHTFL